MGPRPISLPGKPSHLPEPAAHAARPVSFPPLPWASLKLLDVAAYAVDPLRHPCLLIVSMPVLFAPPKFLLPPTGSTAPKHSVFTQPDTPLLLLC